MWIIVGTGMYGMTGTGTGAAAPCAHSLAHTGDRCQKAQVKKSAVLFIVVPGGSASTLWFRKAMPADGQPSERSCGPATNRLWGGYELSIDGRPLLDEILGTIDAIPGG